MKIRTNGNLLVLIAVLLWSLVGLLIKSVEANYIWIMIIRSLSAAIILVPYVNREKIFPLKSVLLAGFFMAVFLLSVTITTQNSTSAMAVAMQYTAPMYVIVYSFYKERKVNRDKFVVLISILIGIGLIIVNSLKASNPISIVTGILTGLGFVFYSHNLQKVSNGNPLGIVSLVNFVVFFCCVILLLLQPSAPPSSVNDVFLIALSGVFISGLSYAFYGAGLRLISIDNAMMIGLLEPILNPLWVYVGTGEIPSKLTVFGVVFIIAGALYNILSGRRDVNSKRA